jgi:hypothetical protein
MLGPVCAQVVRQAEVPASDRKFPALLRHARGEESSQVGDDLLDVLLHMR